MADEDSAPPNAKGVGIQLGEGAAVGGDVAGRDHITAGGHVIQAAAGAVVNIVSTAQVGDGLRALSDMAAQSGIVREAVIAFRTEFQEACRQIDVLGDYKDLHDLLHQLEYECYDVLLNASTDFPAEADASLITYQLKLEDIAQHLQEVSAHGAVARQDTVWIGRLATLPEELDQALNALDRNQLDNVLRRLKQVLELQPSQINTRLNTTARSLRLPLLVQALSQVRDNLMTQSGLDPEKVSQFHGGVEALVNLNAALSKLVEDHDGWQAVEVLLNRIEAMLAFDLQELELSWPDLKMMTEPLCAGRLDKPALGFTKEAAVLDDALASANPDRIRKSFLAYHTRAGQLFYRIDVDLKRVCGELRKVGGPLASVLRMAG